MAKELNLEHPSVDNLLKFGTNNGKAESIVMIPIKNISNFPNHPFKVKNDEELVTMIDSIKEQGVRQPVIIRLKQDGGYEMISGHRRKLASEIAGITEIPAIVRDISDDEAIIEMVDSNIQREKILKSERAFAYKMKLEAQKHQGKTCGLEVHKSRDNVTDDYSGRQVQRYIRLTELTKEILDMVDENKIALSPAVELSYLNSEEQLVLLDCMREYDATPSQAQAIRLKRLSQEGELTATKIEEIMSEEKPNQVMKYKINYDRFEKYLPRNIVTEKEVEDYLYTCAEEHYKRMKQKQISR